MNKNNTTGNLTQSQLLLWAGQAINPDTPLHNTAHSFDIAGEVDEKVFVQAVQLLVNTTDAFRIVFTEKNGFPYQTVLKDKEYILEIIDFSNRDDAEIKKALKARSKTRLDLFSCVFDMALYKVGGNRYVWFLNMHHLVTDAISATMVYKRLTKIYSSLKKGVNYVPESGTSSFSNYIQDGFEKQKEVEKNESQKFWEEKVKGLPTLTPLYGEQKDENTTASKRVVLRIGKRRTDKLAILGEDPRVIGLTPNLTNFNILASFFLIYLHRITGQSAITIGAPTHNRLERKFKETVGLFIEIFPFVIEFDEKDTFLDVIQKVRIESINYLRNAQPGTVNHTISSSFNTVLNFINASFSDFDGIPVKSEWIHTDHIDISHQLRCHIVDFDGTGEFEFLFDFNRGVFTDELIEAAPKHFLDLFDALLEDSNQSIYQSGLIAAKRSSKILREKIGPTSGEATVMDLFEKQVNENPALIALHYGEQKIDYKTLNNKADQLGTYLQSIGIKRGDRVALHLERTPDYIISVIAVLKIGGVFIPIPSDQPEKRVSFILRDSGSSLMITDGKLKKDITGDTPILHLDTNQNKLEIEGPLCSSQKNSAESTAYMIYTSGSTGNPKGVLISHGALANYIVWANKAYSKDSSPFVFPLFTSIGFDLTITSTFLPLTSGGEIVIYRESNQGPDISLLQVLDDNKVNSIKLTPSHLSLLQGKNMKSSHIKTMIVGGEDFKVSLAKSIQESFGNSLKIYNEYGPTEATVGCIVQQFLIDRHTNISVPIGKPIDGMHAHILDSYGHEVPRGVVGELYISGKGLAQGYCDLEELTKQKFLDHSFSKGSKRYRTGDLARINSNGEFEYLGRVDEQIKLRGFRIELPDIEANLLSHPKVENSAVVLIEGKERIAEEDVVNCTKCGLPSNYPTADFDTNGVCHICNSFETYESKVNQYFRTEDQLKELLTSVKGKNPKYDCLSLLSGGKDSTYILAQLINMGMKVLAFTLDNGYISDQAKANIDKIVAKLGVDHIYGSTEHMNKIFVDSLNRHKNVCDGCFKTIYTLSTQIALEKEIPFIVTGLSRGQFFETRLTEELFWNTDIEAKKIDDTILEARKLYHQENDAVRNLLDVSAFDDESTFEKVRFVDFYRYSDVSLEEMIRFLEEKIDWKRPTDTGRSTNCLINQVGIYVHKKQKGYSNYSFPYSWDVRLGHKTRQETLDEINEYIHEDEVKRIMNEIGYEEPLESEMEQQRLVGYYTAASQLSSKELSLHLKKELPDYMVPTHFKYVEKLPLTTNGKVDKTALKHISLAQLDMDTPYVAPSGEIEELLASIWKEVLKLQQIGAQDDFIALGGHSLAAIRVTARLNEELEIQLPLNKIFELPTIAKYAKYIEETITALLAE